jgi:hypothetical protein
MPPSSETAAANAGARKIGAGQSPITGRRESNNRCRFWLTMYGVVEIE